MGDFCSRSDGTDWGTGFGDGEVARSPALENSRVRWGHLSGGGIPAQVAQQPRLPFYFGTRSLVVWKTRRPIIWNEIRARGVSLP